MDYGRQIWIERTAFEERSIGHSSLGGKDVINLFLADAPILYSQKAPENQRFSGVFMGYKMGTLARHGLIRGHVNLKVLYTCSYG